jgi:UDP-N-acetylglucosamine diphosphorylase / glucose-1-phosphate thymidylyltransferase / UDP-N-acetylgalactosamine diphosphorylase / glucosamine-1-phosphate N-acetyltransferase / galactosamine-1-phosphate N-acetyltransferase
LSSGLLIEDYVTGIFEEMPFLPHGLMPWELVTGLPTLLHDYLAGSKLSSAYEFRDAGLCVHRHATVETGATLKPPLLIAEDCFVASHAYLRGGVALGRGVRVGPGCEIKRCLVMSGTTLAHLNFVGDSIIGRDVNIEAGAVVANHWNERQDKTITVVAKGRHLSTGTDKFGALIGNGCRIGANAVLSPGTLLPAGTVVGRLELVDQSLV